MSDNNYNKLEITVTKIPFKYNSGSAGKKLVFGVILFILCALSFIILSSERIIYTDDYYGQVRLSDRINLINDEYDVLGSLDGVSLRTEFDVYSPDTTRVLVYWENTTNQTFLYGVHAVLYKKIGGRFIPLGYIGGYIDLGIILKPKHTNKMVYSISYTIETGAETYKLGDLKAGTYQIRANCFSDDDSPRKEYTLTAEFEISNDKSKWGKSALDFLNGEFDDVTAFDRVFGAYANTDFRLYKNKTTYDSILTDGVHEYDIGKGSGKWGVVCNYEYKADSKIYLVYSYSRTVDEKHCSYLCALDVTDNSNVKEVYKSEPFISDYDVVFVINEKLEKRDDGQLYAVLDENGDFVMDNRFKMFYEKYEDNGYGSFAGGQIGWLVYENGGFFYEEYTENQ